MQTCYYPTSGLGTPFFSETKRVEIDLMTKLKFTKVIIFLGSYDFKSNPLYWMGAL